MMTVLEERTHYVYQDALPRIAKALERIATALEHMDSYRYPDITDEGKCMGPGDDDDDLPF